ncbi:ankyrin repeat-containing domain protein [Pyrenochaeta sp. MPI-SDFR-AT-0127]|nr:ankyrin repeat-containing domain protein [Pyrenochaeta sp. MPI-SDFR-AT-0127]
MQILELILDLGAFRRCQYVALKVFGSPGDVMQSPDSGRKRRRFALSLAHQTQQKAAHCPVADARCSEYLVAIQNLVHLVQCVIVEISRIWAFIRRFNPYQQQLYQSSLEGEHGVIEAMKLHGLTASKPQHETQFKHWGFRKKLTREAWHVIGHIFERQKAAGVTNRLYVYGTEVSSEKVKKETARYRLCNSAKHSCERDTLPDGVSIKSHSPAEVLPSTNKAEHDNGSRGTPALDRILGTEVFVRKDHIVPPESDLYYLRFPQIQWESSGEQSYLSNIHSSSPRNFDNWCLIPSRLPTPSSQFEADASFVISGLPDFQVVYTDGVESTRAIPVNTTSLFKNLDGPMFYEFRALCMKIRRSLSHSVGKTMPLLPWKAKQEIQKSSMDIVVLKQILFLLMNNFAGSDYAAFDALFEQIKHFSVLQMRDILDAVPAPYMSAIQQSILTIAIKSNVPRIVQILIDRGLDADRVTCRFGDWSFTPLGLACEFGHLDIASILIDSGVDVNRNHHATAMNHLLGLGVLARDKYSQRVLPPATCDILRCLLVAGARVELSDMSRPEFWKSESLVDTYIGFSQLPAGISSGWAVRAPITNAMQFCGHARATSAIKTMFGEGFRIASTSSEIEEMCRKVQQRASYEGNKDLVDFLLEVGLAPDVRCLCEAVRGNQHGILQNFCEAGIELDCVLREHIYVVSERLGHSYLDYRRPYAGCFPADVDPHLLQEIHIAYPAITPFAEAIRWNHQNLIHMFQNRGVLNTIVEPAKYTAALLAAAEVGNVSMVRYLVDLLIKTRGIPPLQSYMAIDLAALGNHKDIVEILMSAGIKPSPQSVTTAILLIRAGVKHDELGGEFDNVICRSVPYSKDQISPLAEAIRRRNHDMTRILLDEGADLNITIDIVGHSPLTVAILCEDERLIHELLARGADPNDPEALLEACSFSTDIVEAILDAFCQRYPAGDKHFASKALRRAIEKEDEILVDRLASFANLKNTQLKKVVMANQYGLCEFVKVYERRPTLFGEAIATRNIKIVRSLLTRGADVNSITSFGSEYRFSGRLTAVLQAISMGDLAMVELLYGHGADIHFIPTLGITHTSLQMAVQLGHTDIIHFLLDRGVDVNARSCIWGAGTALQLAAGTGYVGIAELLIQRGANINAPGSKYQGRTAFESAAENGRMDMLLMLYHKGVDLVSDDGEQVRRAKDFAERNGQIAAKDLVDELAESARSQAIVGYRSLIGGTMGECSGTKGLLIPL